MGFLDKISSVGSRISEAAHGAYEAVEKKVDAAVTEVKTDAAAVVEKTEALVDKVSTAASSSTSSATGYITGWNKPAGSPGTYTPEQLRRGWALVKDAWHSPNTGRALSAEGEIAKLKLSNLRDSQKLTPEMEEALIRGVATRRTDTDRGAAGIMGDAQVRDAAATVFKLNAPDTDTLNALMKDAGKGADGQPVSGADAQAERALILKAVAARKDRLSDADPSVSGAAMDEVAIFAKDVRGLKRDELIRTTTPLDLDDKNTSEADPKNPGVIDADADNDGLSQKFDNTCAPTTGQMMRAEADPVYARELHQHGLNDVNTTSPTATDEEWAMRASLAGAAAVTRADVADRDAIVSTINSRYGAADAAILRHAVSKEGYVPVTDAERTKYAALLADLRTVRPDVTDDKLKRLQEINRTQGGTDVQLGVQLGAGTNLKGTEVKQSKIDGALEDIRGKLENGETVAIRIGYTQPDDKGKQVFDGGGHAMLFSDYRDGKYLLSDPYSGKTAWVTEEQVKRGTFARDFGLTTGNAYVTDYLVK